MVEQRPRAGAKANGSRREAILEAGVEIFGTTLYDLISIDDIAEHAGVAHGLLFHYFNSKHGLYLAVLRRIADDLRAVHDVPDRSVSPARQVRAMIDRHIDYIEQHPQTLLAYLSGGVGADPEARAILEESRSEGLNDLLIALGIETPTTAIKMAVRGFAGFLDEAMIYRMTHARRIPRKQLLEMSIEVLVASLLHAGAATKRGQLDPRELLSKSRDVIAD
ncbi:MAG TPA: TetR/AcrR family transcriptional regulator [Solirubrobacteraceae bacterium]|nr:TetR/AcrR family transcriptional regulator [Solirubrobacteraceae bacterium]